MQFNQDPFEGGGGGNRNRPNGWLAISLECDRLSQIQIPVVAQNVTVLTQYRDNI